MAIGGSTNGVIHLTAIARRLGIKLKLTDFDRISDETPVIVNLKPSGEHYMEDLFKAGGIPAVMKALEDVLHREEQTVLGSTIGENLSTVSPPAAWQDVIKPRTKPLFESGTLASLYGNLAPQGAVIKRSAASPDLLTHRGPAVVFRSLEDLHNRIDDPNLPVTPEHVIVLQNAGPIGGPGMPEAGYLPIPKKLLRAGVKDMVRISDARMSGTAFGTIVLHIAPEAAIGGPLALVEEGDLIELDVPNKRLELLVDDAVLASGRSSSFYPNLTSSEAMGCYIPSTSSRHTWAVTLISFNYTFAINIFKEKNRMLEDQYQKGVEQFSQMVGTNKIDELREKFRSLSPDFERCVMGVVGGEIWSRPELRPKNTEPV